jgi:hypothetical protein
MADALGLVPDAVNSGTNALIAGTSKASQALGGPEISYRFPMFSDSVANIVAHNAQRLGYEVLDPSKLVGADRVAYNASRVGGQVALTSGAAAALALARGAGNAAVQAPKLGDAIFARYSGNPTRMALEDAAKGTTGGALYAAKEHVPGEYRQAAKDMGGAALGMVSERTGYQVPGAYQPYDPPYPGAELPPKTYDRHQSIADVLLAFHRKNQEVGKKYDPYQPSWATTAKEFTDRYTPSWLSSP